jgi:hypothetical protein
MFPSKLTSGFDVLFCDVVDPIQYKLCASVLLHIISEASANAEFIAKADAALEIDEVHIFRGIGIVVSARREALEAAFACVRGGYVVPPDKVLEVRDMFRYAQIIEGGSKAAVVAQIPSLIRDVLLNDPAPSTFDVDDADGGEVEEGQEEEEDDDDDGDADEVDCKEEEEEEDNEMEDVTIEDLIAEKEELRFSPACLPLFRLLRKQPFIIQWAERQYCDLATRRYAVGIMAYMISAEIQFWTGPPSESCEVNEIMKVAKNYIWSAETLQFQSQ